MNMANNNTSWERLESVIRWADMTINYFGRHIGLHRSENLYRIKAGRNGISQALAQRIVDKFPELSLGWLLTGEGDMFGRVERGNAIPLYDKEALQRLCTTLSVEPQCYLSVPLLGRCDAAIRCEDESMKEEIEIGSVVFLRKTGLDAIISGALYVIVCTNYVLLRRVRYGAGEERLNLESANAAYDTMQIAVKEVDAIYRVVGNLKLY